MASNQLVDLPPHAEKVIKSAKIIASLVNSSNLFKSQFTLECIYRVTERGGSVVVSFNLNRDNFASCEYYNDTSIVEPYTDANVIYIKSILGYGTGFFIFYLQLLLCKIANIAHITLVNDTDDSFRAAMGIYKRFTVNKRGKPDSNFVGKSTKEQIIIAEHEMRLEMYADFLHDWSEDLIALHKKAVDTPESPWEPDYLEHLSTFFYNLQSTFPVVHDLSSILKNHSESTKSKVPQMKYPKSKSKSVVPHSIINKTRKHRKPIKGGVLISKKSLGKMSRKLHHTRKQHGKRKQYSTQKQHSKKRQMNKRKSKKNSVSRRNKSKSYRGGGLSGSKPSSEENKKKKKTITPYYTDADAMVDLEKAVMKGKYKKVEKLLDKYPTLQTGDYGVWIDPDKINNAEITRLLRSYGFFNVAYNSNRNINSNANNSNTNNFNNSNIPTIPNSFNINPNNKPNPNNK